MHRFDEASGAFQKYGAIALDDAPVALSAHGNLIVTLIGPGCKNFLFTDQRYVIVSTILLARAMAIPLCQVSLVPDMAPRNLLVNCVSAFFCFVAYEQI